MKSPRANKAVPDLLTLPILTTDDCAILFRKPALFMECCAAGWLKPFMSRHKMVLYDRKDVEACISRLRDGELPEVKEKRGGEAPKKGGK